MFVFCLFVVVFSVNERVAFFWNCVPRTDLRRVCDSDCTGERRGTEGRIDGLTG